MAVADDGLAKMAAQDLKSLALLADGLEVQVYLDLGGVDRALCRVQGGAVKAGSEAVAADHLRPRLCTRHGLQKGVGGHNIARSQGTQDQKPRQICAR